MSVNTPPLGGEPLPFIGESDLDLRYYAGVLWRGRWLIVVAIVMGIALSSLVAYLQVPEYQAQALVQIAPMRGGALGVGGRLEHAREGHE